MADDQKPVRSGRGLKILLFVSLAFNLLVVGLVSGAILSGGGKGGPRDRMPDRSSFPFFRALPDTARDNLRQAYRQGREEDRERDADRASDQARLLVLLRADPFDAARFSEALEAQFSHRQVRGAAGRAALVGEINKLTQAERSAYADRLEQMITRRDDWKKRKDRDH